MTVKATADTGLASPDVFAFGNLVGDADGDGRVNAIDLAAVRRAINAAAPLTTPLDFNRDGRVSALDLAIVKRSLNKTLPTVTLPAPLPAALPGDDATSDDVRDLLAGDVSLENPL